MGGCIPGRGNRGSGGDEVLEDGSNYIREKGCLSELRRRIRSASGIHLPQVLSALVQDRL